MQENINNVKTCQDIADLPYKLTKSCGYSLVIVDDLEEEDWVRINRLEKMIITLSQTERSCSRGILFIITSRHAQHIIKSKTLEMTKDNLALREHVDIGPILELNKLPDTSLPLYSNLKDYGIPVQLIPLLPLTREHVRDCTHKMFSAKNMVVKKHEVNKIIDQLTFFSQEYPIYAKHGCKQVAAKIKSMVMMKQDL